MDLHDVPGLPPPSEDIHFDNAMMCIRAFELQQMSYKSNSCSVCHETRIELKVHANSVCDRCFKDKSGVKMFSTENNMNPGVIPNELKDLSVIEQQLISRITPCMNVFMLKHGGIGSSGHCVTFPQEVNEPAKIFPRLPHEIHVIKVCKQGKNETSKNFRVRRYKIESALRWLKRNNPAYKDILISKERLNFLPFDGEMDISTLEYEEQTSSKNDQGPAPAQNEPYENVDGDTSSGVLLPDPSSNIEEKIKKVLDDILHEDPNPKRPNKSVPVIHWPSRGNIPVSEFTTKYFFTLAFPALFPYATGDYYINRPRSCTSMSEWADHLLWYEDGRFSQHQYFKFVVHNMIMRKKAMETSNFVYNQKLGDGQLTIEQLKEQLKNGDSSTGKKILYFSASLRGTSQYWAQRGKELRSLIQYKINEGKGLPSFFTTGSCAEFYFKPLRRLLSLYISKVTGKEPDLSDKNILFRPLQQYPNVIAHYFDLRTQSYFQHVMGPVFGIDTYWYRQEFAKSRGMVHWHGLCWRSDREPHNQLFRDITNGLSDEECAKNLGEWAKTVFGLTACHPAGSDGDGNPRKDFWPPPEGSAPPPPESTNPLIKLLMDISQDQEAILEDHLMLSNRFNLHRCSDYCMKSLRPNAKPTCRMEFPKQLRPSHAIVKDRNGSMRLEMKRDHPVLVQHSRYHTQGWRANGDISLILSKSDPENPSVDEILATEKYITGYACKGNQPTGAVVDLFNDMVNCSNEANSTAKSLCSRFLMGTVKRDVSAVEACYEISSIPLYRSSHTFQSVSLSGCRVLEKGGVLLTKHTALDKYLQREKDDHTSFYSFLCKSGKVPVVSGGSTQATWPLDENFCRTSLLLHYPGWRQITDLKANNESWIDAFSDFLKSIECPNFVRAEVERARTHIEKDQEDNHDDNDFENQVHQDQPEWMSLIQPNAQFDQDFSDTIQFDDGGPIHDWSTQSFDYPENAEKSFQDLMADVHDERQEILQIPNVSIENLNQDQLFAFNMVLKTVTDYKDGLNCFTPLRMIVSGTAGSGKSYLIKCIVRAIRLLFKSNKAAQVLCPTGNSANLISGVTLHSFLKIPTTNKNKEMKFPDGAVGEALQKNCDGVIALLVDERSLIGTNTLGWMEFMSRCGINKGCQNDKSWGGLPVVVFLGDDVQLPPVLDSPVYSTSCSSPASIRGALVWKEFQHAVNLSTIVRQGIRETQFREALLSLRTYNLTSEQAKWLQQFQWSDLNEKFGDSFMKRMSDTGLFVFPTHQEVWDHNKYKLLEANQKYPIARLKAVNQGPHSHNIEPDKASGLVNEILLCKQAKVMLTVNLFVPFGLFNGAIGNVVDIIYKNGKTPSDGLPDVVMVDFPNYTGPPFISENPTIVPIIPVTRKIECRCFACKRTQIPLRLGWAATIHKCQGMTIGEGEINRFIVINPGTRQFESRNPGALFVALSRAKSTGAVPGTFPDFAFHPSMLVNEDRLCHKVLTKTTSLRSTEICRIKKLVDNTKQDFKYLIGDNTFLSLVKDIEHLHNEE